MATYLGLPNSTNFFGEKFTKTYVESKMSVEYIDRTATGVSQVVTTPKGELWPKGNKQTPG